MPAGHGIRDHRLFIIDMHTSYLIGIEPPRARRAFSRRLNNRLPHVAKKYADSLEANIIRHRLIEKLGKAHTHMVGIRKTRRTGSIGWIKRVANLWYTRSVSVES